MLTPDAGPDLDNVVIGRIGKPQGIRGEVTVEVRTDDPETRYAAGSVLVTDPAERGPLTVESSRWQGGRLVVAFVGVPDRSAAEALRDTLLCVPVAELGDIEDPDEFHDFQLRGLAASLPDGTALGTVSDVLHLPQGDVLTIDRGAGTPELLVPFLKAMVPVVDVPGGRVVVDPPAGLLDLTASPDEA